MDMEHVLARSFSNYLCRHKIIEEEYFDIYVYGAELVLSFIVTTGIILIIGIIAGMIPATLAHLAVFIALRRFTGGYHAKTYLRCKIITIAVYLSVMLAARYADVAWYIYLPLTLIGNAVIYTLAPVENPNKPLTPEDKLRLRRLSHLFFTALCSAGAALSLIYRPLGNTVFFSGASVIALMIITIFQKGEQK